MTGRDNEKHDEGNSSFLTDVLGFVSYELNQFVANATGGAVAAKSAPRRRESQSKHCCPVAVPPSMPHHKRPITMPGTLIPRSPTSEPNSLQGATEVFSASNIDAGQASGKHAALDGELSSQASKNISRTGMDAHSSTQTTTMGSPNSCGSMLPYPVDPDTPNMQEQRQAATPPQLESRARNGCENVAENNAYLEPVATRNGGRRRVDDLFHLQEESLRDKERIRLLEEEIRRLKEEVSLKHGVLSSTHPPPPPPPPPPMRVNNKRNLATSDTSDPSMLITSARAALKRAPVPVEAPINPIPFAKRQGLPTVGVPPEKMAAFLNELKSVRLRKISTSKRPSPAADLSANSISFDSGSSISSASIFSNGVNSKVPPPPKFHHSNASGAPAIGAKRKRELYDDGDSLVLPDLRKYSSSFSYTQLDNAREPSKAMAPGCTTVSSVASGSSSRSWLSFPTVDTTTPSLTSDNDHDRSDISPEDLPATPPRSHSELVGESREFPEIIDVDKLVEQLPITRKSAEGMEIPPARSSPVYSFSTTNFFSRRIPLSPLPSDTPRKPHPPSRLRRSPRLSASTKNASDEDLPSLAGRFDGSRFPNLSQDLTRQETSPTGVPRLLFRQPLSRRHLREQGRGQLLSSTDVEKPDPSSRWTLDEELRRAVGSLESIGSAADRRIEDDDVFLGIGTRDKSSNFPLYSGEDRVSSAASGEVPNVSLRDHKLGVSKHLAKRLTQDGDHDDH